MAMSSGTLAVLGTTVVSVLAVGAAVGIYMVVDTPDGGRGANTAMSDDFCTLMGQAMKYGVNGAAPFADVTSSLVATSGNEAVALALLHAQGKQVLEVSGPLAAIERHAAEIVTDPELASAFEASAKSLDMTAEIFGAPARDAETVDGFLAHVAAAMTDPETQAIGTAGDEANATIIAYVGAACGISLDGEAIPATGPTTGILVPTPGATDVIAPDTAESRAAAMADASQIGEALTGMFATWSEGDPLPTVDLADGFYSVNSGTGSWSGFTAASSTSAIADEFIDGPENWCVSVTVAGPPSVTYSYSAGFGLAEGICG